MALKEIDDQFVVGDLVYYREFEIFPRGSRPSHMGIIIAVPNGYPHASSYLIYWFETGLTTRIHYDMIELIHDRKR